MVGPACQVGNKVAAGLALLSLCCRGGVRGEPGCVRKDVAATE